MELNAYGTLILNLSDNIIRQVLEEETTHKLWKKLECLFTTKDLLNKMYLREKNFTYKMDPSKTLSENLEEFKKIVSNFKTLLEIVHSMMSYAQSPSSFWGYVVETAIHILNNVP